MGKILSCSTILGPQPAYSPDRTAINPLQDLNLPTPRSDLLKDYIFGKALLTPIRQLAFPGFFETYSNLVGAGIKLETDSAHQNIYRQPSGISWSANFFILCACVISRNQTCHKKYTIRYKKLMGVSSAVTSKIFSLNIVQSTMFE